MSKAVKRPLFMLAVLLCLAGCGKEDGDSAAEGQEAVNVGMALSVTETLYINDVIVPQFEDPGIVYQDRELLYDTYGSKLYMLWIYTGEEETAQSLYVFDGETKETQEQDFSLDIPDGANGLVRSMDVRDGGRISFRIGGEEEDILVITDMKGNILSRQDPFPDRQEYPWNGEMSRRYENRAIEIGDGSVILSRCREQEQVTELFWYDVENGKETLLSVFEGELIRSLCVDGDGSIFYTTLESLNRWDRESDTRIRLLELHDNGLSSSPVSNNLLANSKGEILFCELDREIPCVYVLSGEESHKEAELRVAYFTSLGSDALARPVNIFFQTNPEVRLVEERCKNDSEGADIRNRALMELAAGRGPDVMWVRDEDLYVLQEKGLLMDLSELIPEETRTQILPGVLQAGTVDGQLVGIKLYAYFETTFVSDAVWEGSSWTREDILEILESREDWESTFTHEWRDLGPYELFSEVLMTDLDGSQFLDTERGYCDFENPEFIRLLEICKKYGQIQTTSLDAEEGCEQLREGAGIACVRIPYGVGGFSAVMNLYSGAAHMVGFPTAEGSRNYLMSDNTYLAVNAETEHVEEIKALLAHLLSYEKQFEDSDASVRMDVIKNCVQYDEIRKRYEIKLSAAGDVFMEIQTKPDGTSWLEEYMAFVESCEPSPDWRYTMVGRILSEELQPYFAGDKSAEEAAEIAQSRVRTYLDESR